MSVLRTGLRVAVPVATIALLGVAYLLGSHAPLTAAKTSPGAISYGTDGSLVASRDYREWIFLNSGVDMVYGPKANAATRWSGPELA